LGFGRARGFGGGKKRKWKEEEKKGFTQIDAEKGADERRFFSLGDVWSGDAWRSRKVRSRRFLCVAFLFK
jgi:hypothetical protein